MYHLKDLKEVRAFNAHPPTFTCTRWPFLHCLITQTHKHTNTPTPQHTRSYGQTPHPVHRNARHRTWPAWGVLSLRDSDPANNATDFRDTAKQWNANGCIYALYHFSSDRWYVGQTVRNYWVRSKENWDKRQQHTDVLHNALANETATFSYVIFPLENIDNAMHPCETRAAPGKILGRPPPHAVAPWFKLSRRRQTSLGMGNAKVARATVGLHGTGTRVRRRSGAPSSDLSEPVEVGGLSSLAGVEVLEQRQAEGDGRLDSS